MALSVAVHSKQQPVFAFLVVGCIQVAALVVRIEGNSALPHELGVSASTEFILAVVFLEEAFQELGLAEVELVEGVFLACIWSFLPFS